MVRGVSRFWDRVWGQVLFRQSLAGELRNYRIVTERTNPQALAVQEGD